MRRTNVKSKAPSRKSASKAKAVKKGATKKKTSVKLIAPKKSVSLKKKAVKVKRKSKVTSSKDVPTNKLSSSGNFPGITTSQYPIIYSYIYERESQDMMRIQKEHSQTQFSKKNKVKQILGFSVVNGVLVPIEKKRQ